MTGHYWQSNLKYFIAFFIYQTNWNKKINDFSIEFFYINSQISIL